MVGSHVVVAEHVFGNNSQLVQQFGNALWKPLAHSYMAHCMSISQQGHEDTDSAVLEQHLQRFKAAEQFETDAAEIL